MFLGDASGAIAKLKAHRLAREAKVLAAMQALPQGSMEDWVRHAYAHVGGAGAVAVPPGGGEQGQHGGGLEGEGRDHGFTMGGPGKPDTST